MVSPAIVSANCTNTNADVTDILDNGVCSVQNNLRQPCQFPTVTELNSASKKKKKNAEYEGNLSGVISLVVLIQLAGLHGSRRHTPRLISTPI